MTFDPAGRSIDEILDYGAPGLQYWEHFLPLYEEAFGPCRNATVPGLQGAYDEQRGTDLAKLDATRTELAKALDNAETQWQVQQSVARDLTAAWTGGTGDQALTMVDAQLRRARGDLDAARTAADALGAAVEPLRQAALAKADSTLALLPRTADGAVELTLGGKTPDDIDTLVADQSDTWLTDTFRPDVEHKLDLFTTACATADTAFETHYAHVISALNKVVELPFPCPRDIAIPPIGTAEPGIATPPVPMGSPSASPAPAQPSRQFAPQSSAPSAAPEQPVREPSGDPAPNPGSGTPSREPTPNSGTARDPSGSGSGSATTPSSTTPETQSQPQSAPGTTPETAPATTGDASQSGASTARSLSSGLESLTSAIQKGITDSLTKLQSLLPGSDGKEPGTASGATEEPKSDTDPGSASQKSEFDLAGKYFSVEQLPDGELRLTVTDETGGSHTYALTFDEHGIPILTDSVQPPGDPAGSGPAADSEGHQGDSPPSSTDADPAAGAPGAAGCPDAASGVDASGAPDAPGGEGSADAQCPAGVPASPEGGDCPPPAATDPAPREGAGSPACAEPPDTGEPRGAGALPGSAVPPAGSSDSAGSGNEGTRVQPGGGMCSPPGEDGTAGEGSGAPPQLGDSDTPPTPDGGGAPPLGSDVPPLPGAEVPPRAGADVPPEPRADVPPLPGDGVGTTEIPDAGVDIPEAVTS